MYILVQKFGLRSISNVLLMQLISLSWTIFVNTFIVLSTDCGFQIFNSLTIRVYKQIRNIFTTYYITKKKYNGCSGTICRDGFT